MLDLLKQLDKRLTEPSTWASLAGLLILAHVNVPAGVWSEVTTYGTVVAGALGVVLSEVGSKPTSQIVSDVVTNLVAALKAVPSTDSK